MAGLSDARAETGAAPAYLSRVRLYRNPHAFRTNYPAGAWAPGLARHSYFLADGRDPLVIDPPHAVDVYLDLAHERRVRIRYVLETHRNEDYVAGSCALAQFTGAGILPSGEFDFAYGMAIADGDALCIGGLSVRALATAGHTIESLSFTVADPRASRSPVLVFTGDALFVGEVGRTDLYGEAQGQGAGGTHRRACCTAASCPGARA